MNPGGGGRNPGAPAKGGRGAKPGGGGKANPGAPGEGKGDDMPGGGRGMPGEKGMPGGKTIPGGGGILRRGLEGRGERWRERGNVPWREAGKGRWREGERRRSGRSWHAHERGRDEARRRRRSREPAHGRHGEPRREERHRSSHHGQSRHESLVRGELGLELGGRERCGRVLGLLRARVLRLLAALFRRSSLPRCEIRSGDTLHAVDLNVERLAPGESILDPGKDEVLAAATFGPRGAESARASRRAQRGAAEVRQG